MKKIVVFLLSIVYSLYVYAETFSDDGLYFQTTSETTVEVCRNFGLNPLPPSSTNPNTHYSGAITIPQTVTNAGITYSVTGIGNSAFAFAIGLTSVVIPEGVEYIGFDAFRTSTFATTVLASVTIPSTVKILKDGAFQGCRVLTVLSIPERIESIGYGSFSGCDLLKLSDIALPSTLKSIDNFAFQGCKELEEIIIPEGITTIGESTFHGCSKLKSVTLPSSLTSIGPRAFLSAASLTDIIIPKKVAFIGPAAFQDCTGLTSIEIPEGITTLQTNTFQNCTRLSFIFLPSTLTSIGESALRSTPALKAITIPHGVKSIENSAFMSSGLESIVLPETVNQIGTTGNTLVFYECTSLKSVDIRASNFSIGNLAFYNCTGLKEFSLACPPGAINPGSNIFYCDVPSPSGSCTLYVPCDALSLYTALPATSPWNSPFFPIFENNKRAKQSCLVVTTYAVKSVTKTSAVLQGRIDANGETVTSKGFEYRKIGDTDWTTEPVTDDELTTMSDHLIPYTLYEYRSFAVTENSTIYGNVQLFKTLAIPPLVITGAATHIEQTSATVSGSLTQGSEPVIAQGIEYKKKLETGWMTINVVAGIPLSVTLNNLTAPTQYDYRAFATTASGVAYGKILTFTTIVPPTVITEPATNVKQTSATISGSAAEGSEKITAKGFEYRESPEEKNEWILVEVTESALTTLLSNLTVSTLYDYRAFATTVSRTTYGDIKTFTTATPPTVETGAATEVRQTSITISGTITVRSEEITAKGFEYKKNSEETWILVEVSYETLAAALSELTVSTLYDYRAFATTVSGTTYGDVKTFETATPPTVITELATSVRRTLATVSGTITPGSEVITAKGFEYRESDGEENKWIPVEVAEKELITILRGLSVSTQYDYRAFAATASGTAYGDVETFTTNTPPTTCQCN